MTILRTVLVGLLLVAAAFAWLAKQQQSTPGLELVTPGGPDVFVDGMQLEIFGHDGQPAYRLTAAHMRHTSADDRLQLSNPAVRMTRTDGATWTVKAGEGEATAAGERVWLHGPVEINRQADPQHAALYIKAREVLVKPAEKLAETEYEARIETGGFQMETIGLEADFDTNRLELNSRVRGRIDVAG